jgi:hypothetical protein
MGRIGALIAVGLCVAVLPRSTGAQHAPAGEVTLTATSANVSEAGSPVKIHILRWSTDEERTPVIAALNPRPPAAAPGAATPSAAAGATPPAAAGLPTRAGANPPAAAGRGRGRGARGGGGDAAPLTPIAALTAAIGKAPTLGYIWTNDITGYSIKYAREVSLPDGGERIILATDRRLGAYSAAWTPATPASVTDYAFTLIEIRLNAKGAGEGKTSLMTKVIVDQDAKTIALDDYAAAPAMLQHVKR